MSEKDERYTPQEIAELVFDLLGTDFRDPCPRRGSKGLEELWPDAPVYVNPPGSKHQAFANQYVAWAERWPCQPGVWMAFNFDTSTQWFRTLLPCIDAIFFFEKRWRFPDPSGKLMEVGRTQALLLTRPVNMDLDCLEGYGTLWVKE